MSKVLPPLKNAPNQGSRQQNGSARLMTNEATRGHTMIPAVKKNYVDLPELPKAECKRQKYTLKHKLSLEILELGFHETFNQIYSLVELQHNLRHQYGVESAFYQVPLLEESSEKLGQLRKELCKAELALRQQNYHIIFDCYQKLAKYFLDTDDKWLSDYFFQQSLEASRDMTGDEQKAEASALYAVGQSYENNDDLPIALRNYEAFYQLSDGKSWVDEDGSLYFLNACNALVRVLIRSASTQDTPALVRAYQIAKRSASAELVLQSAAELAEAHMISGKANVAGPYLTEALELAEKSGDAGKLCAAYKALARCAQLQDKAADIEKYLALFHKSAVDSGDAGQLISSSLLYGKLCNIKGAYASALRHLSAGYTTASQQGASTDDVRVWLGVATAHNIARTYSNHMAVNDKPSQQSIMRWKDSRNDL